MAIYTNGRVVIRDAVEADIQALKGRLRKEDADEVIASGYESVESALAESFSRSTESFTIELDGLPVGMFGIVPETVLGPVANVWFLGAKELQQAKKSFVKMSIPIINEFLKKYPTLWNLVDARYESSVKWLKFCGAQFHGDVEIKGNVFKMFTIRRT